MSHFAMVGKAVRKLRMERGFTQAELAANIESQRATVNRWETGGAEPRLDSVIKALDFLGASVLDFYRALEVVEGSQPIRLRPIEPDPERRNEKLIELLGLSHLPQGRKALFLASMFDLRNLAERTAHLAAELPAADPPANPPAAAGPRPDKTGS